MHRKVKPVASVRDLEDGALLCHGWRHGPWEPTNSFNQEFGRPEFGTREVQACGRGCGTIRTALFARATGAQLTPWDYIWSDGYKVDDVLELADYRREIFRRRRSKS